MTSQDAISTMPDPARTPTSLLVDAKRVVADSVVELTLCPRAGDELPYWEPGAHIDLEIEPGLVRQYSLCGPCGDRGSWTIAILREEAGRGGSRRIHDNLTAGARVRVLGLRNLFRLEPAQRYIFVAGGIGITPIIPMLAAAEVAGTPWELHYGGRSSKSMAYAAELHSQYGDRVIIRSEDEQGMLDLDSVLAEPAPGVHVYCCGPQGLIAAVEDRCNNWPADSLHVERFAAGPADESALEAAFEVVLKQTGARVIIPPDRTIADVLNDDLGIDILTSCEQGLCGTCETSVLEGIPDHRDLVLSPQERERNDRMMVCISRSKSDVLTLDI